MIYVIESGKYFKVGYSKNVEQRMLQYNTHNPDYELILYTTTGNKMLERYLQEKLLKYHYKTEWFNVFEGYGEYITELINGYEICDFHDLVLKLRKQFKNAPESVRKNINPFILHTEEELYKQYLITEKE